MCVWKEQDPHSHVDPEPDCDCKHQHSGQLVTQDPGICKKGLIALVGMQIGAADADTLYAYYGMPDFHCRFIDLDHIELKWFLANNAFQVYPPSAGSILNSFIQL